MFKRVADIPRCLRCMTERTRTYWDVPTRATNVWSNVIRQPYPALSSELMPSYQLGRVATVATAFVSIPKYHGQQSSMGNTDNGSSNPSVFILLALKPSLELQYPAFYSQLRDRPAPSTSRQHHLHGSVRSALNTHATCSRLLVVEKQTPTSPCFWGFWSKLRLRPHRYAQAKQ
jgi:hypothetical protein